ncbi:Cytochrome [Balamuthia mandrillaris]
MNLWVTFLLVSLVGILLGELFKYYVLRRNKRLCHVGDPSKTLPGPLDHYLTPWELLKHIVVWHFSLLLDIHGTWSWVVRRFGGICCVYILHEPVVVVSDPALVKQVMVRDWKIFGRPVEFFDHLTLMGPAVKGSLPRAEGDEWTTLHRIMYKGFKYKFIAQMIPTISTLVQGLIDLWTEKINEQKKKTKNGGTVVQCNSTIGLLTLDVIGKVAFGFDFNALQGSGLVTHAIRFMSEITNPFAYIPYWHLLPTPGNRSMIEAMRVLQGRARAVLTERKELMRKAEEGDEEAAASIPADLLSVLLQKDEITGQRLDDHTITANSIFFMVAGHESTSTAMSWILYLLASHPNEQEKARAEVDEVLGSLTEQPTLSDLLRLEYIECVIKEGLRLYPPAPFNVRRASEDTTLGDYHIPKDTFVFMPVREVHRCDAFEDPHEFRPERFRNKPLPGAFLPFNIGVHNCIGQRFAMIEMRMVLSSLLRNFVFEPVEGFKPQLSIHFMQPKHDVQVAIRKRT